MIRSSIAAILVILGVVACLRPTSRPEPGIAETKTQHVRGAPHRHFPELKDEETARGRTNNVRFGVSGSVGPWRP